MVCVVSNLLFVRIYCRDTVPLSPVEQVRRRIKRRRRTWTDPRTVLIIFALISCFGTLVFVYLKASQGLP